MHILTMQQGSIAHVFHAYQTNVFLFRRLFIFGRLLHDRFGCIASTAYNAIGKLHFSTRRADPIAAANLWRWGKSSRCDVARPTDFGCSTLSTVCTVFILSITTIGTVPFSVSNGFWFSTLTTMMIACELMVITTRTTPVTCFHAMHLGGRFWFSTLTTMMIACELMIITTRATPVACFHAIHLGGPPRALLGA